MSTQSEASRLPSSVRSASSPKPVTALIATEPPTIGAGRSGSSAALSMRSTLLSATSRGLSPAPELVEHGLDGRPVLGRVGVRGVDDLDQDVGPVHLLEGGPERVDELVGQLVDEPDGVGRRSRSGRRRA